MKGSPTGHQTTPLIGILWQWDRKGILLVRMKANDFGYFSIYEQFKFQAQLG